MLADAVVQKEDLEAGSGVLQGNDLVLTAGKVDISAAGADDDSTAGRDGGDVFLVAIEGEGAVGKGGVDGELFDFHGRAPFVGDDFVCAKFLGLCAFCTYAR
jgi:hypothetical protein